MKKFLLSVLFAAIVVAITFYFINRDKIPSIDQISVKTDTIKIEVPIIERVKDDRGVEHVILQDDQNKITQDYLKNKNRPANIVDSTAANLKIATETIKRITQINTLTRDSLLKARKVISGLNRQLTYVYSDPYVQLKFTPPVDTLGTGSFDFLYNADLSIVQYQKRKWFLGQKKSFIDISSKDVRTTVMGVKQLTIEQETPQFGLRLQASSTYDFYTNNFGFGPGIRVDVGRSSFQGNYIYYPTIKSWHPAVSANFDLLRF